MNGWGGSVVIVETVGNSQRRLEIFTGSPVARLTDGGSTVAIVWPKTVGRVNVGQDCIKRVQQSAADKHEKAMSGGLNYAARQAKQYSVHRNRSAVPSIASRLGGKVLVPPNNILRKRSVGQNPRTWYDWTWFSHPLFLQDIHRVYHLLLSLERCVTLPGNIQSIAGNGWYVVRVRHRGQGRGVAP
jgi:hypothetical protein